MKNIFSERCMRYALVIYRFYFPVLVWMSVIFLLSAQPSLGIVGQNISFSYFLLRKSAHIVEYFVLGILLFRVFRFHFAGNSHTVAAGTVLVALFFALSDEAHQLFIIGRQGRASDVGIDALGILLSIFFCLVVFPWWIRRRKA